MKGRCKGQQGAGTSLCIALSIRECPVASKQVDIYALQPKENFLYRDMRFDLISGLECSPYQKVQACMQLIILGPVSESATVLASDWRDCGLLCEVWLPRLHDKPSLVR